MKAWQRRLQEAVEAEAVQRYQLDRQARAARIEQETATLVERVRTGKATNAKTKRRMRALERLTGQKALTVHAVHLDQHIVNETWDWRVVFSDGQTRAGWRFSKQAAESDIRRVIQDMVGAS